MAVGRTATTSAQTQRLDTLLGAILRIDPRSPRVSRGTRGIGDYTIPPINKFAADGDPKTFGEIYAYGFRNAHRLSWDPTDGTMFAVDIGNANIEEINIVREGGNYGWMRREGIFENGLHVPGGNGNQVYELPADILVARRRTASSTRLPCTTMARACRSPRGFRITAASRRCVASSSSATSREDASSRRTWPRSRRPTTAFRGRWRRYRRSSCSFARRTGRRSTSRIQDLAEKAHGEARPGRLADFAGAGRRALRDLAPGRHDPNAGSGLSSPLTSRSFPAGRSGSCCWLPASGRKAPAGCPLPTADCLVSSSTCRYRQSRRRARVRADGCRHRAGVRAGGIQDDRPAKSRSRSSERARAHREVSGRWRDERQGHARGAGRGTRQPVGHHALRGLRRV